MSDLLDAVDRLTKPIRRTVKVEVGHRHDWQPVRNPGHWRRDPESSRWKVVPGDEVPGSWYCLYCDETTSSPTHSPVVEEAVRREETSALEQLSRLVAINVSGNSSGSQQPSRRIPLDTTAFDLLERIDGRIRAWYLDLGERAKSSVPLSDVLRKWYVRFTQLPRSADQESSYLAVLNGWWDEIRDIVDPPARQEITSPCPVCHQTWVQNDDPTVNSPRALWALWRDSADDSDARCLNCETRWVGVEQMRSLRIRIDEEEAARAAKAELVLLGAVQDDSQTTGREAE